MGKKINKRFLGIFMGLHALSHIWPFPGWRVPVCTLFFYTEDTPHLWFLFCELLSVLFVWDEANKIAYLVSVCKIHLNRHSGPPATPGSCSILNSLFFVNNDTSPLIDSYSSVAYKGDEQLSEHLLTIYLLFSYLLPNYIPMQMSFFLYSHHFLRDIWWKPKPFWKSNSQACINTLPNFQKV